LPPSLYLLSNFDPRLLSRGGRQARLPFVNDSGVMTTLLNLRSRRPKWEQTVIRQGKTNVEETSVYNPHGLCTWLKDFPSMRQSRLT
jgi:hypothetical protein